MLFLINNAIYEYDHTMKGHDFESVASYILTKIEKAGLLPPNTMPDSLQLTERNAEFLAKVNRHFKWESEDEA